MKTVAAVLVLIAGLILVGIGPNPRYLEELRIGGGRGDSDGGADFEKDGTISTDGKIGIGLSPTAQFQIKSSGTDNDAIEVIRSGGTEVLAAVGEDASGNGVLKLRDSSGTENVLISSNGESVFKGGGIDIGTATGAGAGDLKGSGEIQMSGTGDSYVLGDLEIGTNAGNTTSFSDRFLTIRATESNGRPALELHGNYSSNSSFAGIYFLNEASSASDKRAAQITALRDDDDDAAKLKFNVADDNGVLQSSLELDQDSVITTKEVSGFRQYIGPFTDQSVALLGATPVILGIEGITGSSNHGLPMARSGDITGLAIAFDLTSAGVGNGNLTFEVYKNGSATGLTASYDLSGGTGSGKTVYATQNKGSDTFSAGDKLQVAVYENDSGGPNINDVVAVIEIATD